MSIYVKIEKKKKKLSTMHSNWIIEKKKLELYTYISRMKKM